MASDWIQPVATAVVAAITFLGVRYQVRANRQQIQSGATRTLSEAAANLIEPYRVEVIGLRAELEEQRRRRQDLADQLAATRARVDKLESWIAANTATHPSQINGEHS